MRLPAAVFLGALLVVMFFHQGLSANPMSRLFTVFGVVEDGTLRADRWGDQTVDKAVIDGHVYSDKAPLASFLVIPFYAAWRALHPGASVPEYENAGAHLGDLVAAAIPFALFAVLLQKKAAPAVGEARATTIALVAASSTCLFDYGNIYYGHMLASLLVVVAYVLVVERSAAPFLAGLAGGFAVLAEYPTAMLDLVLLVALLGPRGKGWRRALWFAAGAAGPAALVLAYNVVVTGRPFDFPYAHVGGVWGAMQSAYGMREPSAEAAWELVFGQYRGLLFYAPALALLAPLALARPKPDDPEAQRRRAILLALVSTQFVFVCCYFKWDGGWCTGPRHLAPMIALLVYAGAGALARHWARWGRLFYEIGAFGIFVNVAAAATDPIPPEAKTRPLFEVFLPALRAGNVNAHNLAQECGLPGGAWLLGLWAALFVGVAWLLAAAARRWSRTA